MRKSADPLTNSSPAFPGASDWLEPAKPGKLLTKTVRRRRPFCRRIAARSSNGSLFRSRIPAAA